MKNLLLLVAPMPALFFFKFYAGPQRAPETLLWVTAILCAYCFAVVLIALWLDRPTYFDWTILAYFSLLTAAFWLRPTETAYLVQHYGATGVYGTLFCSAVVPLLAGWEPFTMHIAKKGTPREFWKAPDFIRINRLITGFWSFLFAVGMGLSLIPSAVTRAVIPVTLFAVLGVPFTLRFPDWYLKRKGLPTRKEQQAMAQQTSSEFAV